jgi:glycosyltransferase involved in cell wall biosynthesis
MHLTNDFDASGGQYLLYWLLTAVPEAPQRPVVCGFGDGALRSAFDDAGVQTEVISAPSSLGAVAGLRAVVRREGAALIHTSTPLDAPVGIVAATLERVPLVHTFHALPPTGAVIPPRDRSVSGLVRRGGQRVGGLSVRLKASRLIAYSEVVRSAQAWSKGIDPARIDLLHPGLPADRLAPPFDEVARKEARAILGVDEEDLVLIGVGRLEEAKGQRLLVDAVARLVGLHPAVRLLLVGEGEGRSDIEAQVRSAGLGDHVRLLGRRGDVASLLRASDVFVSTSRTEGFGLSVVEAMAAATPVVAFGGPDLAFSSFIADGRNGRLLSDHTVDALVDALHHLLADPAERAALGTAGREVAIAYTAERAAAELFEVHREVLAGQGRRRRSPGLRLIRRGRRPAGRAR